LLLSVSAAGRAQLTFFSMEYFHGILINIFPAWLKKSIIFTSFRMYFLSLFVREFSYSESLSHPEISPLLKIHSLANVSASHSLYSKFSLRSVIRSSISRLVSPSLRPAAEWALIHPPHSLDIDTVSRIFSLKWGSIRRKVIKNVGPENIRKNFTKRSFNDVTVITVLLMIYYHLKRPEGHLFSIAAIPFSKRSSQVPLIIS